MKKDEQVEIDGTKYILKAMGTSEGARTLVRIGRLILPNKNIISIFDMKKELPSFLDMDLSELLPALGGALNEAEFMDIVETVLKPLAVITEGGLVELSSVYNVHFAGRYDHLFKVFFTAIRHNYASFFVGLPGIVGSILGDSKAKAAKKP